jgi:23S rRNA maturation mini-RNase III
MDFLRCPIIFGPKNAISNHHKMAFQKYSKKRQLKQIKTLNLLLQPTNPAFRRRGSVPAQNSRPRIDH